MDAVNETDILSRYQVPRHRLTVRDYHRLGEAGVLDEDSRVELLEGQLVDMSPIGPRHALAIDILTRLLLNAVGERAWVKTQNPIVLDDTSEPQPDFSVVRHPWHGYPHAHPRPPDVHLVVEVADSGLEFDRGAKLELYARGGIREFWIVDLTTNRVLVHRDPTDGTYTSVTIVDMSGTLQVEALPEVTIHHLEFFGSRLPAGWQTR
jgi:Uma2 family endonuclease